MLNLKEIIEENNGPELVIFEEEVSQLSQEQLEQLNVEEGIYTPSRLVGIHRDLLEISAAEVRWPSYFMAYSKVMGRPSVLDPNK